MRGLMRSRRAQRGAAAVEFALVLPLLLLLVFGIIDYGFWFNDSNNARQGVREAARQAVVKNFTPCGGATTDMGKLRCVAHNNIAAVTGPSYVRVSAPDGWVKGKPLVVCAMVKANGLTGIVPLPNNRLIKAQTRMSIEVKDAPTGTLPSADTPPAGADWSWCT